MFDSLDNPVGVVCGFYTVSQGALRDPGLSWTTASRLGKSGTNFP